MLSIESHQYLFIFESHVTCSISSDIILKVESHERIDRYSNLERKYTRYTYSDLKRENFQIWQKINLYA